MEKQKYQKKYGIFRYIDNVLYGYVENSFSMGWKSDYARTMDKRSIDFYLNEKKKVTNTNPLGYKDAFILRLTSSKIPVRIDWESQKRADKSGYITKFNRRNVRFFPK